MVNRVRKLDIKQILVIVSVLLLLLFVSSLAGCGTEQAASADQPFKDSLKPVAEHSAAALSEASSVAQKCTDYATSSQPMGTLPALFSPASKTGENKTAEMAACPQEIAQTQAKVTSAIDELKSLTPPDGCDSCRNEFDAVNSSLTDAAGLLPQFSEAITAGAGMLSISDDEFNQIEALPPLGDRMTMEEFMANYSWQADIFRNTAARWQALAVPADIKNKAQKVIEAKQAEADVALQQANGPSTVTQVQIDLSMRMSNIAMEAMGSVQSAYGSIRTKLGSISGSLKDDKSRADQVVSDLSPAPAS